MRMISTIDAGMAFVFTSQDDLELTIKNLQTLRNWKASSMTSYPAIYAMFPPGMSGADKDAFTESLKAGARPFNPGPAEMTSERASKGRT